MRGCVGAWVRRCVGLAIVFAIFAILAPQAKILAILGVFVLERMDVYARKMMCARTQAHTGAKVGR